MSKHRINSINLAASITYDRTFTGPEDIRSAFEACHYLADDALATVLFLALKLPKPLLLEGNPGVGKTDVAIHLAEILQTDLIRLQCHEGLDVQSAVYEWNYQKQLLSIKLSEQTDQSVVDTEAHIFGPDFLLERPLLKSIRYKTKSPVLLIDEIDRADEEFEAFLLELLSAFQISIPEMGTVHAECAPIVLLTSNRTRELGDALKRRCLYYWISYPDFHRELRIIRARQPAIDEHLAVQIITFIQKLRKEKLNKTPGIAESLDWANALLALNVEELSHEVLHKTIGCFVKSADDLNILNEERLTELMMP